MLLVEDYLLGPGACYLCGAAKRFAGEVIIDTQLETGPFADRAGRIYICSACVDTMGTLAGMVNGETHARAEELCKTLGRDLASAHARANHLAEAVDALTAAGYTISDPEVHPCPDCGESFETRRSLGQHRRVHTPPPPVDEPPLVPESFSDVVNA